MQKRSMRLSVKHNEQPEQQSRPTRRCNGRTSRYESGTITNRRESCNRLVQWLAFGGEQIIATNDRAAQRKIMKDNHVVANGTIVSTVIMIRQVLQALYAEGQTIDPDASADVNPLDEDQHPPPRDESIVRTAWLPDTRRDAAVATSKGTSNQDQEAGPVQ